MPATDPRRWTLRPCPECDNAEECSCGLQQCGHHGDRPDVEVMPVSEHERLREAAQAFVDAALNPFDAGELEFARLRAVLTEGAPE